MDRWIIETRPRLDLGIPIWESNLNPRRWIQWPGRDTGKALIKVVRASFAWLKTNR
jgi:hypothetical protein